MLLQSSKLIASGLATNFISGSGIGIGIGIVFASLIIGISRNPSLTKNLFTYAILGFALNCFNKIFYTKGYKTVFKKNSYAFNPLSFMTFIVSLIRFIQIEKENFFCNEKKIFLFKKENPGVFPDDLMFARTNFLYLLEEYATHLRMLLTAFYKSNYHIGDVFKIYNELRLNNQRMVKALVTMNISTAQHIHCLRVHKAIEKELQALNMNMEYPLILEDWMSPWEDENFLSLTFQWLEQIIEIVGIEQILLGEKKEKPFYPNFIFSEAYQFLSYVHFGHSWFSLNNKNPYWVHFIKQPDIIKKQPTIVDKTKLLLIEQNKELHILFLQFCSKNAS